MTEGLWLITSGAFIGQELAAEFGQMPPSFLPIGTRRLYEYQLERIGSFRPVYLTIPETYKIPAEDERRLGELGVTALSVPEGIGLGESVVFALNLIGGSDQSVRILHGDTLIDGFPGEELDWIGTATKSEGYSWAEVDLNGDQIIGLETVAAGVASELARPIICGYFAFAHTTELVRSITRARGDFVAGIAGYARKHILRAIEISAWYDFGHVQTFFRSRRLVTSARHFNSLRIDGKTARKTSSDAAKIRAEASWLTSVPSQLRIYCARLIDSGDDPDGQAFYETEYDYLPTLSELFVFGTLGRPAWMQMIQSCHDFMSVCAEVHGGDSSDGLLRELVVTKTLSRLGQFADRTGFDVDGVLRYNGLPMPSLVQIAQDIVENIDFDSNRRATVMHGDFCFSNILYDSRIQRIHVIDPRGYIDTGRPTIYGDVRYDLAKLSHSVVGRYDQIIAGRYHMPAGDGNRYAVEFERAPHHAWLESALDRFEIMGIRGGGREVRALTIGLFLSMLPLHSDRPDRQRAFIANALRLYAGLEVLSE